MKIGALFAAFLFAASGALAAQSGPALLKAKKEAEAKGYIFFTSHDEIVDLAKKEEKLHGIISLDPDTFGPLTKAFKSKYPFIDLKLEEVTGTEATQRFLLEIQSGTSQVDVSYISEDFYIGFIPQG
jgi:ABC-type glycerol-3-phosphate transport system substrate-binding protein